MNRSHIHQFSYNNINKSSLLTYLGHNFYLFFVSEKFILFTWAILLLEKLLPYETSTSFSVVMEDFSHFNRPFA